MGATALLDHVRFEISSGMDLRSQEMIDQTRERLAKMGFKPEEILTNY